MRSELTETERDTWIALGDQARIIACRAAWQHKRADMIERIDGGKIGIAIERDRQEFAAPGTRHYSDDFPPRPDDIAEQDRAKVTLRSV